MADKRWSLNPRVVNSAVWIVIGWHHHALAGRQAGPGDLDQAVGIIEESQIDRDQALDTIGSDYLNRVPPFAVARRASMGTTTTLVTVPVVIVTSTGAWSQDPVARVGRVHEHRDGRAQDAEPLLALDEEVATVPTDEITPGVVSSLGKVMVTRSPAATSDCWSASKAMLTWRVVEVAVSTVAAPATAACHRLRRTRRSKG